MWKYIILAGVLLSGLAGGYGFVFGGNFIFNSDIRYVTSLSRELYLGDENTDSTLVFFRSNVDISEGKIISNCSLDSKFIQQKEGVYVFEIDYSRAKDCKNGSFVLQTGEEKIANASGEVELKHHKDFFNILLDYDTSTLEVMKNTQEKILTENAVYQNYTGKNILSHLSYAKGQSDYYISSYKQQQIEKILSGRSKKYTSPVQGYSLQYDANKIPNTGRPYRSGYTDGIHRGWDIDAPIGTSVVALDDGIIVRVVSEFHQADFSRIVYGENLSEMQQLKNLDILRGKQVWLKTLKGDVVFYSHLDGVNLQLKEGDFIKRGENIGTIGVSGVPGEGYDDYHLHFAIMKNPYNPAKVGSYDFGDYMSWDWLTKGMNHTQTVETTKEIFE